MTSYARGKTFMPLVLIVCTTETHRQHGKKQMLAATTIDYSTGITISQIENLITFAPAYNLSLKTEIKRMLH